MITWDLVWVVGAWTALVLGAIGAVAAYLRNHRGIAVGILVVLATVSRFGAPFGDATVRLEQAAILGVAVTILIVDRPAVRGAIGHSRVAVVAASLYLVAHVVASALFAPQPVESLRIAAWLAVSITGGAVVAVIVYRSAGRISLGPWLVGAAMAQVVIAVLAVASQVVFKTDWGVQSRDVLIGKAFGLSHEANLFGILIAVALPFAIFPSSAGGLDVARRPRILAGGVLTLGLGLSYSRGSLIAFGAAIGLTLAVEYWRRRPKRAAWRTAGLAVLILIGAVATMQGQDALARSGARDTTGLILVDVAAPDATPVESFPPGPSAGPSHSPEIVGTGDTSTVRMRSIRGAMTSFVKQPLVGHGTDAYGQRHKEITCRCPAHISNLPVATLYESGLVGAFGLGTLILVVVVATVRLGATALTASILAMLIGYLFTDAMRFAISWMLIGAPLGAAAALHARATTRFGR